MLLDDLYFREIVVSAYDKKLVYEKKLIVLCDYLRKYSPRDYKWYFNGNGFLQVDVPLEFLDDYLEFVEELVDCKYTTVNNLSGVTVLLSLSVLNDICKETK